MPGFCRGLEKQYLKIDQDQTICLVDTSTHASTYVLSSVIVKRNYIVSCASLSGNRRDIQRQKSGFFQHPQWWLKRMEFLGISGLDKSRPPPGAGAPQQVWPLQLIFALSFCILLFLRPDQTWTQGSLSVNGLQKRQCDEIFCFSLTLEQCHLLCSIWALPIKGLYYELFYLKALGWID